MDENKNYTIVGKVEIGTDEYRDLIERNMELKVDFDRACRQKWEIDDQLKEAQKKLTSQKDLIENYKLFLSEKELTKDFDLWVYEKSISQKNQDEE